MTLKIKIGCVLLPIFFILLYMKIEEVLEKFEVDKDVPYFVNPYFADAVIGVATNGALVYDYDKMVECATKEEDWSVEDAIDWIEFNTIRTIPYMGEKHPIIVYT